MYGSLVIDLYTLAIVSVLLFYSFGKRNNRDYAQKCTFQRLLSIVFVLIIADLISMTGNYGYVGNVFSRTANFITYFLDPFVYFFGLSYINIWLNKKAHPTNAAEGLFVIGIINAIVVLLNEVLNTGWLYFYDEFGMYQRGDFYFIRAGVKFLCLLFVEWYVISNRESFDWKYRRGIMLFPLMPIIGGTVQAFILPWGFEYTGLVFSCLVLFISVQSRDVNHDYLTNAVNRRMMDTALEDRLKWNGGKTFSGIMIDVDYFKNINDKFGHSMGDAALVELSKILHESFRKNTDMVARYGGDEFFVIADIQDPEELQKTITRVYRRIFEFNRYTDIPYELSISVGAAVYDPAIDMNMDCFRNRLDKLMYEEKRKHHEDRDLVEKAAFGA